MKAVVLVIISNIALLISAQNNTLNEHPDITNKCSQQEGVPQHLKAEFYNFQYANNETVHKHILCVSTEIQIWDNTNGFNLEKIAHFYRDRANEMVIKPIISKCNLDNQSSNESLWCYGAFLCILNSQVGEWFKDDIRRKRKGHQ